MQTGNQEVLSNVGVVEMSESGEEGEMVEGSAAERRGRREEFRRRLNERNIPKTIVGLIIGSCLIVAAEAQTVLFGASTFFGVYHWVFAWIITILICGAILLLAGFFAVSAFKSVGGLSKTRRHSLELGRQRAEAEILELNTGLPNAT